MTSDRSAAEMIEDLAAEAERSQAREAALLCEIEFLKQTCRRQTETVVGASETIEQLLDNLKASHQREAILRAQLQGYKNCLELQGRS